MKETPMADSSPAELQGKPVKVWSQTQPWKRSVLLRSQGVQETRGPGHVALRFRSLQTTSAHRFPGVQVRPAGAQAAPPPGWEVGDREERHGQQHPPAEALPLQARGHGGDPGLRHGELPLGLVGRGNPRHPRPLQPRGRPGRPGLPGESPLLPAVGPGAPRRAPGDPARPLHRPGPAGLARGEGALRGGHRGARRRGLHPQGGPGAGLAAAVRARHRQPRPPGAGGRVRGPLLRLRQPSGRRGARGAGRGADGAGGGAGAGPWRRPLHQRRVPPGADPGRAEPQGEAAQGGGATGRPRADVAGALASGRAVSVAQGGAGDPV
ncbi:collagen alpha-1(I) chain-like isoform X5 [Cervus canadensis]|uniref:collagen alpha-1(I) chain-like isoform X5 n=1 Tax=Cervus canadensis TaxID=1574408 RepID=UPI001C9E416D|nr:collagen alpha-1(I) chain-like isoform X5 [Cervus canadensis]XP_043320044.1 collagen alpha-1(I) chain-like isoform X5 [Cervus canadensis]XP_043320045.1 collagen alpha-1(I) chain-like isoform X5 [Cervus canadensis]